MIDMGEEGLFQRPTDVARGRTRRLHDLYVGILPLIHDDWAHEAETELIGNEALLAVRRWVFHSAAASYEIINKGNFRERPEIQEYALGIMADMSSYKDGVRGVYRRFLLMVGNETNRVAWAGVSIMPSVVGNRTQIYVDWLTYNRDTIVATRRIDGARHLLRTFTIPENFAPNAQTMIVA